MQDFSTEEVQSLAGLADPQCYGQFVGISVTSARHRVEHKRALECVGVRDLIEVFKIEMQQRAGQSPEATLTLPSEELLGGRVGGKEEERRVDLAGAAQLCFLKHFVEAVELRGLQDAGHDESVDALKEWKRFIFFAVVPEDMVEDGVMLGMRPVPQSPSWIRAENLKDALRKDGFSDAEAVARCIARFRDTPSAMQMETGWRRDGSILPLTIGVRAQTHSTCVCCRCCGCR